MEIPHIGVWGTRWCNSVGFSTRFRHPGHISLPGRLEELPHVFASTRLGVHWYGIPFAPSPSITRVSLPSACPVRIRQVTPSMLSSACAQCSHCGISGPVSGRRCCPGDSLSVSSIFRRRHGEEGVPGRLVCMCHVSQSLWLHGTLHGFFNPHTLDRRHCLVNKKKRGKATTSTSRQHQRKVVSAAHQSKKKDSSMAVSFTHQSCRGSAWSKRTESGEKRR